MGGSTGLGTALQGGDSSICHASHTPKQHTHLKVRDHSIHELLTEWRVGLKGTTQRGKVQAGPGDRGEYSKSQQDPARNRLPLPLGSHIEEMTTVMPEAHTRLNLFLGKE